MRTPEAVIAQLRTIRSQISDFEPLSQAQRKRVRRRIRPPLPLPVPDLSTTGKHRGEE